MTELEKQLLDAFEQLQLESDKQHQEFVTVYKDLVKMYETTSSENRELRQNVSSLSEQVKTLNVQFQRLMRYYDMK
ncbi:MbeD family mobilization/exclusion protein [Photobacterium indicum]